MSAEHRLTGCSKTSAHSRSAGGLDLRSPALQFLNDLEKDARYKRWPPNLQEYLRPAHPSQLRQVGKNAITGIFVVDPAQRRDIDVFVQLSPLIEKKLPMRFGVLFTSSALLQPPTSYEFAKGFPARFNVSASAAASSASIMLIRAYAYVKKEEDSAAAMAWLHALLAGLDRAAEPTVEVVQAAVTAKYGASAWVRACSAKHLALI